ncbi:MAG: hypothetical protein Q9183_006867, partial [Haloplaca sp. 2 TL-2023]
PAEIFVVNGNEHSGAINFAFKNSIGRYEDAVDHNIEPGYRVRRNIRQDLVNSVGYDDRLVFKDVCAPCVSRIFAKEQ